MIVPAVAATGRVAAAAAVFEIGNLDVTVPHLVLLRVDRAALAVPVDLVLEGRVDPVPVVKLVD